MRYVAAHCVREGDQLVAADGSYLEVVDTVDCTDLGYVWLTYAIPGESGPMSDIVSTMADVAIV